MVLGTRALNRALLARQGLLERRSRPPRELVEHLVGLQAQVPQHPYFALWSRIEDFDPEALAALVERREVLRIAVMRSTIHLVTADDALRLRPLMQPVIERSTRGVFGARWKGLDLAAVTAAGRELLDAEPLPNAALGRRLAERWPDRDREALVQVVRAFAPLVQPPPRGLWSRSGRALSVPLETYLGRALASDPSIDAVVLRYLGAFGPASVLDAQRWCGLTRLGAVFERLRPQLVTFAGEDGRELFDLPDAPRPDPDVPAPPRFLPEYDNVLLSHADRRRIRGPDDRWGHLTADGPHFGTVLVDGFVGAIWRLVKEGRATVLRIWPLAPPAAADRRAVVAEGERLAAFAAADAVELVLGSA